MRKTAVLPLVTLMLSLSIAHGDEGMWTYDNLPSERIRERYGFEPTASWIEHVRLSSARLGGGCSASFVSADGLVLTNHHCVTGCIEDLSRSDRNLGETGFLAAARSDETRCPRIEVNQLVDIRDVTAEVDAATKDLEGETRAAAERAVEAKLERECGTSDRLRCDVVGLYGGGLHHLYVYRRWSDVRLVFAPEWSVAFFGGDPDNFNYPRYNLDAAFLRIYEDGQPARTEHFFRWNAAGAREGDLVFVSGNPGSTSRLDTVADLADARDRALPSSLIYSSELRGRLTEFSNRSAEARRVAKPRLLGIENGLKSARGRLRTLSNAEVFGRKVKEEEDLRRRIEADPSLKAEYGSAWDAAARAIAEMAELAPEYTMIEGGRGFSSRLWDHAKTLVRAAGESTKPDSERLPPFRASRLPRLRQSLFAETPIDKDLELATLTFSLTKLVEELGVDHPFVRKVLGKRSPREAAEEALTGSRLDKPEVRRTLFEGGAAAIEASDDPMIRLAARVDPDAREIRRRYEDGPQTALQREQERIARARFAVYGTSAYPDATFSPRLSYGTVRGWVERGRAIPPFTTFRGLYDRWTGREPFDLPKRWLDGRDRLPPEAPFNFVTTNDIVGGNSGSPVIDREGRLVGLVFDGNLPSLGGTYIYDGATNRTVAVHAGAILQALDRIYGARRLVEELGAPSGAAEVGGAASAGDPSAQGRK